MQLSLMYEWFVCFRVFWVVITIPRITTDSTVENKYQIFLKAVFRWPKRQIHVHQGETEFIFWLFEGHMGVGSYLMQLLKLTTTTKVIVSSRVILINTTIKGITHNFDHLNRYWTCVIRQMLRHDTRYRSAIFKAVYHQGV